MFCLLMRFQVSTVAFLIQSTPSRKSQKSNNRDSKNLDWEIKNAPCDRDFFGQNLLLGPLEIFQGILPFQLMFPSNGNIQWHQSNAVPYDNVFPTCTRQTYDPLLCVNQVNCFNTQQWQQSSFTYWNNCPLRYERESVQQPCTHSTIEPVKGRLAQIETSLVHREFKKTSWVKTLLSNLTA